VLLRSAAKAFLPLCELWSLPAFKTQDNIAHRSQAPRDPYLERVFAYHGAARVVIGE
jgi:hypothetical protein